MKSGRHPTKYSASVYGMEREHWRKCRTKREFRDEIIGAKVTMVTGIFLREPISLEKSSSPCESERWEEQPGRREKDWENGDAYDEESLGIFLQLNTPVSLEAPHLCRGPRNVTPWNGFWTRVQSSLAMGVSFSSGKEVARVVADCLPWKLIIEINQGRALNAVFLGRCVRLV